MPPSVNTPSMSRTTSLMRLASADEMAGDLRTDRLAGALPDLQGDGDEPRKLVQRHHGGPVARGMVGVGMRFEEERVGARGSRGVEERGHEFPQPSACAVHALPRLLYRVRGVEHDGDPARRAQAAEIAHVDDQIAVAEKR